MKTAVFTVKNEDNICSSSLKIDAPINSTKQDILELYFEKYYHCEKCYQDMKNANYCISSDELEISNL